MNRAPLATDRLRLIDADHLTFRLKIPWSDGTTHLLLSPLERIEKLAALIPPPRLRLVAALTDPDSIHTYLTGVGLPAEPPATAPASHPSSCASPAKARYRP
ncbi:MAG: hypothetical protein HOC74_20965 [Gemmatimonadetes bacterium]|nr:hypothetical protein [Gemmatimonadota bacterium]